MSSNVFGIVVYLLGIGLLIFGFNASQSLDTEVVRFLSGNTSERSVWLLIAGILSITAGFMVAVRGGRSRAASANG